MSGEPQGLSALAAHQDPWGALSSRVSGGAWASPSFQRVPRDSAFYNMNSD